MSDLLQSQWDVFHAASGLSFFLLLSAARLMRKLGSKPGVSWAWLGCFGLLQCIAVWTDPLGLFVHDASFFHVAQLGVLAFSYVALILWLFFKRKRSGYYWIQAIVMALFLVAFGHLASPGATIGDCFVRGVLGPIAAVLGALDVFQTTRNEKNGRLGNVLFGFGLVVLGLYSEATLIWSDCVPSELTGAGSHLSLDGLLPALQCAGAVLCATGLWINYRRERYSREEGCIGFWQVVVLQPMVFVMICLMGSLSADWASQQRQGRRQQELSNLTRMAARGLNSGMVAQVSEARGLVDKSTTNELHRQIQDLARTAPSCCAAFLFSAPYGDLLATSDYGSVSWGLDMEQVLAWVKARAVTFVRMEGVQTVGMGTDDAKHSSWLAELRHRETIT